MIIVLQLISSLIPVIGIIVLMNKTPTPVSVRLLMANIGCLVLDMGYFSVFLSGGAGNAMLFFRVQFLGNILFYTFFVLFVACYLRIKIPKCLIGLWLMIELSTMSGFWISEATKLFFKEITAEIVDMEHGALGNETIYQVRTELGTVMIIRNCTMSMFLLVLLVVIIYRIFKIHDKAIRVNLIYLAVADAIFIVSLIINMFTNHWEMFIPICLSAGLLTIVIKVINGELLTVADQAREWTFENMQDLVIITDPEFGYLDSNAAAKELFPELKKAKKNEFVPEQVSYCLLHNKGDYYIGDRVVHVTLNELRGKKQVLEGYCCLLQDVTEDRRYNEQLQIERQNAEEANKAKSTFLSNMSHEIRTPMNAIVGMTEILMRGKHTEEDREYLSAIQSSGQALLAIINDILDYSKAESGRMELVEVPYDIVAMLKDLKLMLLTRSLNKPVDLLFDVDEKLPRFVYGDSLRLRQVIINIVNNAIKFTKEGYVKLIVRVDTRDEKEVSIYFCVKDTGQGIKDEDLKKLFKSFSQVDTKRNRNVEGTGLGLAISKQLVELMGGNIGVSSVYGNGSEFYFTITQRICTEEEAAEVANLNIDTGEDNRSYAESFTAPSARILIVDDNPMNLKVAKGLFAPIEMQIDTADSAAAAFELIDQNDYDIVFMDHMMPVMDGVEATTKLRNSSEERINKLTIIALTANALAEAREEFAAAGMNDFIAKPINMKEASDKLLKWLPADKIKYKEKSKSKNKPEENSTTPEKTDEQQNSDERLVGLEGIDISEGLKNSGSEELLLSLLADFRKLIDVKATKMEKCLEDGLIKDYTIEVHSLKSTARMIGAMKLSEMAKELEELGNKEEVAELKEKTPDLLELYRSYKEKLSAFAGTGGVNEISKERFLALLDMMAHAADSFDTDTVDAAMKELEEAILPETMAELMDKMRIEVADLDMENLVQTIENMKEKEWISRA